MTQNPEHASIDSTTKQALRKIRDLKRKLAEADGLRDEGIAIVSMACRFPRRSDSPEAFWESLASGTDEVGEIPADRWDLDAYFDDDPEAPGRMYARRGAFLEGVDLMDPDFFGISPREATWIDPQQRVLLEVSWEALERAGWPADLVGQRTGVFVGWMHNDYQNECSDSLLNLNPYIATGSAGASSADASPTSWVCRDRAWPSIRPVPRRSLRSISRVRVSIDGSAIARWSEASISWPRPRPRSSPAS